MKNYFGVLIITLLASGCASTEVGNEYTDLPVTHNELQSAKWADLNRFPARYPENAAINSVEGCATIEYVITPQNEVKDVEVIAATERQFGVAATRVVQNWNWSDLPEGIITKAVKTQTRFDFCFDEPNQSCKTVTPEYSCPGDDIIYSTGRRMN